jgi:hypothetical protein
VARELVASLLIWLATPPESPLEEKYVKAVDSLCAGVKKEEKLMKTLALVLATIIGPMAAVFITRWRDKKMALEAEKKRIFRVLLMARMDTEKQMMLEDEIPMLPITFNGSPKVLSAYNAFVEFRYENRNLMFNPDADIIQKYEAILNLPKDKDNIANLIIAVAKDLELDVTKEAFEYYDGVSDLRERIRNKRIIGTK